MMNLPRLLLIRIRRAIRRQAMNTDRSTLKAIEEWTGYRPTPNPIHPMKRPGFILALIAIAVLALGFLTGCVETTTTAKDGSVTTTKAPAPGVLRFAGAAITAYSPRPIVVREEKSGRITLDEISNRWKPAP